MQLEEKIRKLTLEGKSQKAIAKITHTSRSGVYRRQRLMGLCKPRFGRRVPLLPEAQECQVLQLFQSGHGATRISKNLGISERQVRLVAKKFNFRRTRGEVGYRYHLSEAVRAKIIAEIRLRQNFARDIAWKYRVAYKIVLALAHRELACPKFRSGYGEPLSSHFPQKIRKSKASA